jgi:WD40 repeat protein
MHTLSLEQDFYVAGGTLMPDAPCYVARQADEDLYESLRQGKYCYVLTARQMGKSSLMVRTAARLCAADAALTVVALDLTRTGQNVTLEQWYRGLLFQLGWALNLEEPLRTYWHERADLGPLQRWCQALREVVLPRCDGRLIVFVDEIDAVRSLPFPADEFFAGIRECYNLRATDAAMERLTFCLLGVATPSDLIRDTRTTPFNIGRRIELHDFTAEEAAPLRFGLPNHTLLTRILHWTGGHPYLTQRLCQAVAAQSNIHQPDDVDRLCQDLFISPPARERDDNLTFVRERMLRGEHDVASLLTLYADVRRNRRVSDDPTNPLVSALHLAGVVAGTGRGAGARLQVRNRIYAAVFDQAWVQSNLPDAEWQRQRAAYRRGLWRAALVGGTIVLLAVALAWSAWRQREAARRLLAAAQPNLTVGDISTQRVERLVRGLAYNNRIKQAQAEWEAANVARVEELLNECRPVAGAEDMRGFEWHHLWRLSHPARHSFALENPVAGLAFTRDGAQLLVAATDSSADRRYELSRLDWRSGQRHPAWASATGSLFSNVQFSGDLRFALAEDANSAAHLLDLATGQSVAQFGGHPNRLSRFALAPDSRRVVTADMNGGLKFWERASVVRELARHPLPTRLSGLAFSHDSRRVVTLNNSPVVRWWDAATGQPRSSLRAVNGVITNAVFFPGDQRLLCAARDGSLQVYEINSGQLSAQWLGHTGQIKALAFAPDGSLVATASEDHTVRLWEAATGRALAVLKGHGSSVDGLAWSADGAYLASGDDERLNVWELAPLLQPPFAGANTYAYLATAFAANGHLLALAVSGEGAAQLWDITARRALHTLDEPGGNLYFATFSRDGSRIAAGGNGNRVAVWDAATGRRWQTLSAATATKNVVSAAFAPDGQRLALKHDAQTLKIWDIASGRELQSIHVNALQPACASGFDYRLVFAPVGNRLAVACRDASAALLNLDASASVVAQSFTAEAGQIYGIAFAPRDDVIALGGAGLPLALWDARTGQIMQRLGQTNAVQHAVFAPDGQRLVTGSSDGTVKIWDVVTGQELLVLHKHADTVTGLAFSRDGTQLASCAADGTLLWWQTEPNAK